ncbi:site-specific integrase [Desulfosarcina ovata]|uniref:Integrase n=1 Tax=Desulfosarcina ovata subsp. ovata TaxID=2752305 RepID=A0A5K8A3I9_9BACT|nr:site-specific integrase [Desulfosarcina ovata]BBO87027.1 integrase [Desulfosarcina ovata subsp. ovata]BBO91002.1 integrase [Desulfosarcina ovata subsp. ovata]BBO91949.1 integrase [Desulfosarcina ovata subsp. ovata]BBO92094.1 integrase [Desulfosarcina ovata subsp. ovata]BBO93202.1 integrase [Desulfosarcina ovata subsp. ovata]
MKPTDFATHLTGFLSVYLPRQKNASNNTIASYRDTFKLLLRYCQEEKDIPAEKLNMGMLTHVMIADFLEWLEKKRKCSTATRNQRLAAIHSFFRYAQYEEPSGILHFQKVIAIPVKKASKPSAPHLTPEAMKFLLSQPDKMTVKGRRNLTLLSVLYDSGCRVQELADLRVRDVVVDNPALLILTGKGNKMRRVPLMKNTLTLLQHYLQEHSLDKDWKKDYPLFVNKHRSKLTKEGIAYIISQYVVSAKKISASMPEKVTPHMFRHSKAMHLLQAGVSLIYIRDFLGHEDIKTTEIYAKCDTELKRQAIENAYPTLVDSNLPDWNKDAALLEWLSNLK